MLMRGRGLVRALVEMQQRRDQRHLAERRTLPTG
jgi:hypothetical protein